MEEGLAPLGGSTYDPESFNIVGVYRFLTSELATADPAKLSSAFTAGAAASAENNCLKLPLLRTRAATKGREVPVETKLMGLERHSEQESSTPRARATVAAQTSTLLLMTSSMRTA